MLREKAATSTLLEMADNTHFLRMISETNNSVKPEKVRRLVMCSGKIYYELIDEREKRGITDVAIIRMEQIAPFPWDHVAAEVAKYSNAQDVVWCQEEPKNMGCWSHVQPRIATATKAINGKEVRPIYAGRKPSAATATGLGARAHNAEQSEIYDAVFATTVCV